MSGAEPSIGIFLATGHHEINETADDRNRMLSLYHERLCVDAVEASHILLLISLTVLIANFSPKLAILYITSPS